MRNRWIDFRPVGWPFDVGKSHSNYNILQGTESSLSNRKVLVFKNPMILNFKKKTEATNRSSQLDVGGGERIFISQSGSVLMTHSMNQILD